MITKVYIDNFRCFTNFELELGPFHLLLGENGSGKSSLFDALVRIQRLLLGVTTRHLFRSVDLTGWDNRTTQEFAVEMRVGEDQFRYELRVEHEAGRGMEHIAKERLFWFSSPVYAFESGHAQLYSVSPSGTAVDASFPTSLFSRSGRATNHSNASGKPSVSGSTSDCRLVEWTPTREMRARGWHATAATS